MGVQKIQVAGRVRSILENELDKMLNAMACECYLYMVILAVKRSGFWFLKQASGRSDESKHTLKLEKTQEKSD